MNKRSWFGILLIAIGVLVSAAFVYVSTLRDLSALENTMLQIFSLGIGILGSYVLGLESAKDATDNMIRPHAKSAFRRLVTLLKSLSRLAEAMQDIRLSITQNPQAISIVDKLEATVIAQIGIAADALEDWRDVLPDDFKALQASSQSKNLPAP